MTDNQDVITDNNLRYELLLQQVGDTLSDGRKSAVAAVNAAMVKTYWEIGRYI